MDKTCIAFNEDFNSIQALRASLRYHLFFLSGYCGILCHASCTEHQQGPSYGALKGVSSRSHHVTKVSKQMYKPSMSYTIMSGEYDMSACSLQRSETLLLLVLCTCSNLCLVAGRIDFHNIHANRNKQ